MKKIFSILFSILFFLSSYSQEINDLKNVESIYFYGYDFTDFKLADARRMTDPMQKYIFGWIGYINAKFPENDFKAALGKEIVYDFAESTRKNKNIKDDEIVTIFVSKNRGEEVIEKEYFQKKIFDYKIKENTGVGLIAFMEYAEKATETTSVRFILFDVTNKKIISTFHSTVAGGKGIGLRKHWGKSFVKNLQDFTNEYFSFSTGNCGKKPIAPPAFNNPQYKFSSQYKAYKIKLKKWNACRRGE